MVNAPGFGDERIDLAEMSDLTIYAEHLGRRVDAVRYATALFRSNPAFPA